MLQRLLFCLFCFSLGAALPAAAAAPGEVFPADYRLLRQELHLAKENQIYFVFDLPAHQVSFRASGLSVAELPLAGWRLWGHPREPRIDVLVEKDTLAEPQRTKIRVAPAAETPTLTAGGDLQALEIDDMPVRYQLLFDDGTVIRVAPCARGVFGRIIDGWRWAAWCLSRPLISDWKFFRGKPYTELVLVLQPRDAQLLYWSFTAGGRSLIRWPLR